MTEQAASLNAETRPPARDGRIRLPHREKLSLLDWFWLTIDNPVLRRELLTALRSNKAFLLQFLYLFVLGAVVYLIWPGADDASSQQQERARQLLYTFGSGQLVLLSILSPAFSASAMTIEKERNCLDLLLASPIRPDTILMGKYLSSTLYLLLLVVSSAPIVSVCMWLPGIASLEIVGMYMLLIAVACSFGMIGLTCSTFFHRTQTSVSISYMIVMIVGLILLLFTIYEDKFSFFYPSVAMFPTAILMFASILMYRASRKRLQEPFNPVHKPAEEEDISTQTGLVLVRDRFPDNLIAPPHNNELLPDGDNPIYLKEIRSEVLGRGTLFLRLIIQISMFLSIIFLAFLYMGFEHIFVDYLVVFTMLVAPAFASITFSQERERGTLDLLMTTLIPPRKIILGKLMASLRLTSILTALVGITILFYLLVNNKSGLDSTFASRLGALTVYLTILFATIVLQIALGMFFSMICRNSLHSMIATYASVLVLFAMPIAAKMLLTTFALQAFEDARSIDWWCFTSPFQAAYSVTSKLSGESRIAELPPQVWPWYLAFAFGLSAMLLGYIFARFSNWATRVSRSL